MWPFTKRKRERSVVTFPGDWHTNFTGNPWGTLNPNWLPEVSPRAAENLAAVLAATNAIAGTIASLPAYVTKADDTRADVPDHALQRLIDFGVNDDESWSDFIEGLLASCLLRGNALAEISTDDRGRLRSLATLPWHNITPYVDDSGGLMFDYTSTVPPRAGKRRRLMRGDVLFVKDRSDDGIIGMSRLSRAAGALGIALELQTASSLFLSNAARPGGALTTEQMMDEDVAKRAAANFQLAYSGRERGKMAVLSGGLKFDKFPLLSSEDSELVAHRNFSVADVARIFQVPPFMLADPSRSTFASAREGSRHFAMMCLSPWVKKIERGFAQSVLSSQFRLVIDLGDLLRADPEARWASWQRARQSGILSPNEIRIEEGWPTSTDPTADLIEPPISGGKPAGGADDSPAPASPAPPSDDSEGDTGKVAILGERRARHVD